MAVCTPDVVTAPTGQVDTTHQAGPWPRVVTGAHSGHSQSGADTGTTARVTHRDNNKDNRRHPNKITQHGDQSQESDDRVSRAEMTCSK